MDFTRRSFVALGKTTHAGVRLHIAPTSRSFSLIAGSDQLPQHFDMHGFLN
jgi:hypothetical protein